MIYPSEADNVPFLKALMSEHATYCKEKKYQA